MAYIGRRPDEVFRAQATHDTFTGDGSTTTFDLSFEAPDNDADLQVFVDNVRQEPGSSKSYTIGADGSGDIKRITFVTAPASSAEIYVINPGRDTSLIDVADAAVTTAKLGSDAVTGAKLADDAVDSEHLTDGSVDNVHLAGSIANSKLANSSITINGTAVSLGGSVTAGTDWQSVVVADGSTQLAAVAGRGYFLDTNEGVIEVTLPSSPSRGDTFIFADYGNNFATNRVIIDTGGKLIDSTVGGVGGADRDFQLTTNGQVVEIVFADDTAGYIITKNSAPSDLSADEYALFTEATGGTVTTSGDFKIHSFTGDGTFAVSQVGNSSGSGDKVSYLVVAGGGGGGGTSEGAGGGAGAGGFREGKVSSDPYTDSPLDAGDGLTITETSFPITVGAGGTGGHSEDRSPPGTDATSGSNSIFSTITSAGGGAGGQGDHPYPGTTVVAKAGGSGGGGVGGAPGASPASSGNGNTPPVSPPQGTNGGNGQLDGSNSNGQNGGGGGGATQAGQAGAPYPCASPGGKGGDGATTHITGSPVAYSGGGGGGRRGTSPSGPAGAGGTGGGAAGALGTSSSTASGTANTGGGGGGGGRSEINPSNPSGGCGGAGGKGIVIIRYKFQ